MTYIKKHFVLVLLFSALSMNSRLACADEIVSAQEQEAILNVAKGFGSASLDKDSDGDPMIVGRVEGTKYVIFFYGGDNVNQGKEDIKFGSSRILMERKFHFTSPLDCHIQFPTVKEDSCSIAFEASKPSGTRL